MPVATTTAKGLMSATDKKHGINYFYISGGTLIKLCTSSSTLWKRSGGFVLISVGNDIGMFVFTIQKNTNGYDVKIKSVADLAQANFFRQENDLYFYFNTNTGTHANVFGISKDSFTNMGAVTPDDTYTEIPIE